MIPSAGIDARGMVLTRNGELELNDSLDQETRRIKRVRMTTIMRTSMLHCHPTVTHYDPTVPPLNFHVDLESYLLG
jgi:hypothetical protein